MDRKEEWIPIKRFMHAPALPQEDRSHFGLVFLLALFTSALMFLPSMVYYGGAFYFSGDFNVQQIPFYQMGWRAVHEGQLAWTWTTDLGANFLTSYSFYMSTSPFFWLACLFPYEWLPFMMAPLLMLKTACAAVTGYLFVKRFCKNQNFAMLGGLLYAFSGWATYNIFFNHFHEPMVFFPLLLVTLEELVMNNRKGLFALAVALNAIVNYFFFAGQVTFVVLYFFLRFSDKNWRMTIWRFLNVAFEAVLGVLLAAFVLLPSIIVVLNNPRTTNYATGFHLLFYDRIQRYGYILQTLFFPPELPARLNFFPEAGSRWSSIAAWLPFVSMSGVFAFVQARNKHWLKRIFCVSLVMALVPVLNSLFFMLNSSYYARWFYMPVLMMALATVKALAEGNVDLKRGMRLTAIITLVFTITIGLLPKLEDDTLIIGLYENAPRFWGYVIIALYCLLMFWLVYRSFRYRKSFPMVLCAGICLTSVIYGVFFLLSGSIDRKEADFIYETSHSSVEEMGLDRSTFWRMDIDGDTMDNQGFFWDVPNIQCFQSVVPASIMDFYPQVGVTRDVGSRPEQSKYALRGLLSVKYLFIAEEDVHRENEPVACTMPGFVYYDTQNQFEIYENTLYVPMGFAYDFYLTQEQFDGMTDNQRARTLIKTIVLNEEQVARYGDILQPIEDPYDLNLTEAAYQTDCDSRRAQSCYYFAEDTNGFTAKSNLPKDELMFFSVPYEENAWTATVNGEPVPVEKVSVGFVAVRVPAGEAEIRFHYETPGLRMGTVATLGAAVVWMVYVAIAWYLRKTGRLPGPRVMQYDEFGHALFAQPAAEPEPMTDAGPDPNLRWRPADEPVSADAPSSEPQPDESQPEQ